MGERRGVSGDGGVLVSVFGVAGGDRRGFFGGGVQAISALQVSFCVENKMRQVSALRSNALAMALRRILPSVPSWRGAAASSVAKAMCTTMTTPM